MEEIIKAYRNTYIGKEFVRISKYGTKVKGTVKDISGYNNMIMDDNTTELLKYKIDQSIKGSKTMDKPILKENLGKFTASQYKFSIISNNDVVYDIEECYFIF